MLPYASDPSIRKIRPRFLAVLCVMTGAVLAATAAATPIAGGDVSGTWTAAASPYIVQGDVTVPTGATLVIEPGVVVQTEAGHTIHVKGRIEALGSEDLPILMTGPAAGQGWKGVRVENSTELSRFVHCTLEFANHAWDYEAGGALAVIGSAVRLEQCTLRANVAYLDGAAIYCDDADLTMIGCTVEDNRIAGTNSASGGGVYCGNSVVEILDSRFSGNRIQTSTFFGATHSRGGGIALVASSGLVAGCIVDGNWITHSGTDTESTGGGIYVSCHDGVILRGNTIYGNAAYYNNHFGGGVYLEGYDIALENNIVAGNVGAGVWFGPSGAVRAAYNDFHGNSEGASGGGYAPTGFGFVGQTNVNGDPCDDGFNLFLDPRLTAPAAGDFSLEALSPCIDAGDPAAPADPDGTLADLGAVYFPQHATGVRPDDDRGGISFLLGSRPDPMTGPSTRIAFRNPQPGAVELVIYDLRGRKVRRLLDGQQPQGVRTIDFDGRDDQGRTLPSGTYFYRLQVAGRAESGKMTIIR